MDGEPLTQAKTAIRSFVERIRPTDSVAIVSFADDVRVDRGMSTSRNGLDRVIGQLEAGGGTRLYDAIASGVRLLEQEQGVRVVVYLTDGDDNRSNLTARNIRQMNVGEHTIVYGVGLGNVDHGVLRDIALASTGTYNVARTTVDLASLYDVVQRSYYERFDTRIASTASMTITSIPSGRPVRVGGQPVGRTPVRVDGLSVEDYEVAVEFDRGMWVCDTPTRASSRTIVTARERDVPLSLTIETAPTRAAVFLNDSYVGLSSIAPSVGTGRNRDTSQQLTIESVPPGDYTVRVVAAPDVQISENQVLEFPITVRDDHVFVKAHIFLDQIEDRDGNRQNVRSEDPFGNVPRAMGVPGTGLDDIRSRLPGR